MEIWKDIPGYEDYQVSNLGRVKSLKFGKELVLTPKLNKGYHQVGLCNKEDKKQFKIHKLVTIAFLGHIPDKMKTVVDHINGIKTDNRLENLRLVTNRENTTFGYLKKKTASKYTGVNWHSKGKKWQSSIYLNEKLKYIGLFKCELAAAVAYNKALKELNKEKI